MGREIRMVPPNYQHPKDDRGYVPMHAENAVDKFNEWLADFDRIRAGDLDEIERKCYGNDPNPLASWLLDDGSPPNLKDYRPWNDAEATWVQVWETVSEGTPVTPPFATREELIDYLVAGGDDWDRKRGRGGYSREQATAFVSAGWAPSFVVANGVMSNAIESSSLKS